MPEAAQRYEEKQMRWHRRLIRALRPYGDDSTSVGINAAGRSFEALAELVMAAAGAKGWAAVCGLDWRGPTASGR